MGAPGMGGPGFGGGFGFPFLLPFFGFGGGGSLFTILIFFAIASFLFRALGSLGSSSSNEGYGQSYDNPPISVAKVQVGLLSSARELQAELNELAEQRQEQAMERLEQVRRIWPLLAGFS